MRQQSNHLLSKIGLLRHTLISIFLFLGITIFGQNSLGEGKKAPPFSLKDTYGAIITPESFKGKVLYIDVWATWCKHCLEEHKSFNQLIDRFKDYKNDIAFIGVSIDETEVLWKKTLRKRFLKGTQVIAENGGASQIVSDYNIGSYPHYILIDKDGNLVNANAPKPNSKEIKEVLSSLLTPNSQKKNSLKKGDKAPLFSLKDTYGAIVNSDSYKGKVLYINVWATWCKPCLKDRKLFNRLYDQFKENKEITFLSVSIDESEILWKKMVRKRSLKGIQVITRNGIASPIINDYSIKTGSPHYILIDKNGNLVDANAPRPNSEEIDKILSRLLR